MKIVFSSKCLEYSEPGHPDSPERIRSSYEFLKDKFDFVPPGEVSDSDVLLVHSQSLLDSVKSGRFYDADSPAYPNIYDYAMLSAGAAVTACRCSLDGETAMSLMRPPGHHAGKNLMGGFCYFNNVAIAVAQALEQVSKAAIIDFDCHHGNGTEDIFLGRVDVLYVSLHQSPLYPGTGLRSRDNCLNFPVPAGTDEASYMATFTEATDEVKRFAPDLIAVSAGFDSYRGDPLTGLNLEALTYNQIGTAIRDLGKPVFAVLEGGYSTALSECIHQFLQGLG